MQFSKKARIVITGGNGFLGTHVVKELKKSGYPNIYTPPSRTKDLRIIENCRIVVKNADVVIHLAAMVGGIGFNKKYPADIFYSNLLMGTHILHEAYKAGVKKFVGVGTVCAYPKYTPIPFREEDLWNGYPEDTNAPYGLAKKMLLVGSQAYRKQYNFNAIHLIPVNLYGPGDNFSPESSHVIPALIQKIYMAKCKKVSSITVWGSGIASREFLYVTDCARAICLAMERYDDAEPINLGSGKEISIRDLVYLISHELKYTGEIIWDKTKPDGQPKRLLNTEKAEMRFGFRARTSFATGLKKTIQWYIKTYGKNLS